MPIKEIKNKENDDRGLFPFLKTLIMAASRICPCSGFHVKHGINLSFDGVPRAQGRGTHTPLQLEKIK